MSLSLQASESCCHTWDMKSYQLSDLSLVTLSLWIGSFLLRGHLLQLDDLFNGSARPLLQIPTASAENIFTRNLRPCHWTPLEPLRTVTNTHYPWDGIDLLVSCRAATVCRRRDGTLQILIGLWFSLQAVAQATYSPVDVEGLSVFVLEVGSLWLGPVYINGLLVFRQVVVLIWECKGSMLCA